MTQKAIILLLTLAIVSCATLKPPAPGALVGKWRADTGDRLAEFAFTADGKFTGNVKSGGAIVADFAGTWSLQDGAILYHYTSDTTGNIPPGTRDQDKLIAIDKNQFTIQAADGSRRRYGRVAP